MLVLTYFEVFVYLAGDIDLFASICCFASYTVCKRDFCVEDTFTQLT